MFSLTIAYAALSTVLNITGTAQVQSAKWDIHFANIKVKAGSVAASTKPTISGNTVDFAVTLNKPGDVFEFTVDVVNAGSIDAMIEGIVKTPTLTPTQQKYLTYNITYNDGNTISNNQLLKANKQKTLKVNLTYRKDLDVSDIPESTDTLHLSFQGVFSQADGSSVVGLDGSGSEIPKLVRMVKGDLSNPQIGDMFAIKNERFYIYSSTETTVTGLAEYNLYVGGEYNNRSQYTSYGSEATGIQNSEMIGGLIGDDNRKGITAFSSDSQKGVNYSDYKGSIVEGYVNKYKDILISYGAKIEETRLITFDEMTGILECSESSNMCTSKYPWLYSTAFWLETSYVTTSHIWALLSNNYFRWARYDDNYSYGVRPVVTILKSEFNK